MIATKTDVLENKITDEWLALVAGRIYDEVTGNEPDGDEDPGMLAAMQIIHGLDAQSGTQSVPIKVSELAKTLFDQHAHVWSVGQESWQMPEVRQAWDAIVRWSMFAVQSAGEADAAAAVPKFVAAARQKLETADVR